MRSIGTLFINLGVIMLGCISVNAQENKFQLEIGVVKPPSWDEDEEFSYSFERVLPQLRLDFGYEVNNNYNLSIIPKLGITVGQHQFIKLSSFELSFVNISEFDSVFIDKSRLTSYLNLSSEFKKYFKESMNGFYLYGEPQLQLLLFANQTLTERIKTVETRRESSNQKDRYHAFSIATKLGFGYELKMISKFSAFIAYEFIIYPWNGHAKTGTFERLSRGIKLGVKF